MSTKPLSQATASCSSEEDDIGALIYRECQLRKKEAAEADARSGKNSSNSTHRATSTRRAAAAAAAAIRGDSSPKAVGRKVISYKRNRCHPSSSGDDEGKVAAKKTDWSKYKKKCSADGCTNLAKKGGVCVRHGAKVTMRRCSSEGCMNFVRKGGVCIRHGANVKRKLCSFDGCPNQDVKGGVCIRHGARQKRCRSQGCTNQARKGGVCVKHGAKVKHKKVD